MEIVPLKQIQLRVRQRPPSLRPMGPGGVTRRGLLKLCGGALLAAPLTTGCAGLPSILTPAVSLIKALILDLKMEDVDLGQLASGLVAFDNPEPTIKVGQFRIQLGRVLYQDKIQQLWWEAPEITVPAQSRRFFRIQGLPRLTHAGFYRALAQSKLNEMEARLRVG